MDKQRKEALMDVFCVFVAIFLILATIRYHFKEGSNGYHTNTGLITAFFCIIPVLLRRGKVMNFPMGFTLIIVLAVFFHGYGSLHTLYDDVAWFDIITHTTSSATVGLCVFYTLMVVNRYDDKIVFGKNGIAIFIVLVAVTFSVYWEVFEIIVDLIYDTTMQYSPFDTVRDMVSNSLGGLLVALYMRWFLGARPDYDVAEEFELHPALVKVAAHYGGQSR